MPRSNLFIATALALAIAAPHNVAAQTAYKCVVNGKTTWQDTPCAGEPEKTLRVGRDDPQMKEILAEISKCGESRSKACQISRERLEFLTKVNQQIADLRDAGKRAELADENKAADARKAYRDASEDYIRIDRALKDATGTRLNELLDARSAAAERMRKASKAHYQATSKWLD